MQILKKGFGLVQNFLRYKVLFACTTNEGLTEYRVFLNYPPWITSCSPWIASVLRQVLSLDKLVELPFNKIELY